MTRALISLLPIFCLAAPLQAAPLQNGDFSSGFDGWSGLLIDSIAGPDTPQDPATDATHFQLPGAGLATLANDPVYFGVALYQDFDLPADAAGLSLDFAWDITDATTVDQDLISAVLVYGPGAFDYVELLAGVDFSQVSNAGSIGPVDIAFLAGSSVTLEFLLLDGDFDENDTFSVGNIVITTAPTALPAPAPLTLLGAGLLTLTLVRRRSC